MHANDMQLSVWKHCIRLHYQALILKVIEEGRVEGFSSMMMIVEMKCGNSVSLHNVVSCDASVL